MIPESDKLKAASEVWATPMFVFVPVSDDHFVVYPQHRADGPIARLPASGVPEFLRQQHAEALRLCRAEAKRQELLAAQRRAVLDIDPLDIDFNL